MIQCGTEEHALRALEWVKQQLEKLKLLLHPVKTRIVMDREAGFDFLGFHHRRMSFSRYGRRRGKESWGVLRWPSARACQRFRERIRQLAGPPGRLRPQWEEVLSDLGKYMVGWCQYYRHGQSSKVFRKLDNFVSMRVARNLVRGQPTGRKRKRRCWTFYLQHPDLQRLPRLMLIKQEAFRAYRGAANVRWRAV